MRKDPSDDVNACEDFFLNATEGHILAAAMQVFAMSSLDGTPWATLFAEESSAFDPLNRRNVMIQAVLEVVKKYVDIAVAQQDKGSRHRKSTDKDEPVGPLPQARKVVRRNL